MPRPALAEVAAPPGTPERVRELAAKRMARMKVRKEAEMARLRQALADLVESGSGNGNRITVSKEAYDAALLLLLEDKARG